MFKPIIRSRGFTLLEMVIAIGIFVVISTICYATLSSFIRSQTAIETKTEKLRALQSVFTLLSNDLQFAVSRPVHNQYGDQEQAFIGGSSTTNKHPVNILQLTTIQSLPINGHYSGLKRVSWTLNDGVLTRRHWQVLDRTAQSKEYQRNLLTNITNVTLKFYTLGSNGEVITVTNWTRQESLPRGVSILITLDNNIEYQRFFEIVSP